MSAKASFDLLEDPWILALDLDGRVQKVSLVHALTGGHKLRRIVGEIPTQEAAILRLLLAVLHRALPCGGDDEDAREEWGQWWRAGQLPDGRVLAYLEMWAGRFDLLDAEAPFYQVADLQTASGGTSGLNALIAEVPAGHQLFTTRVRGESMLEFDEAARWLVHVHAFDVAGIKTGALGDERVRGGKGYGSAIGWAGALGLIVLEGATLAQTLLLNLVHDDPPREGDVPPWELPPLTAAVTGDDSPAGPVQAMTWQSRRVRLIHDGVRVVDTIRSNGDPIRLRNQSGVEWMSGWRRSETQEKKHREATVYMPLTHRPGRAIWRGLEGLFAVASADSGAKRAHQTLLARSLSWTAALRLAGVVSPDYPIMVHAVGISYINQSSVVEDIMSDRLRLNAAILSDRGLQAAAIHGADVAMVAATLVGRFAADLAVAAGRDGTADRELATQEALGDFDLPFRQWAADLCVANRSEAEDEWRRKVRHVSTRLAQKRYAHCSPQSVRGRVVKDRAGKNRRLDAASAYAFLRYQLNSKIPVEPVERVESKEDSHV